MKETYAATPGTPCTSKRRAPLPPVALTALRAIQTTKVYPKGSEFFLEGQSPLGIYILYSGRVELSVTDTHGRLMILGTALPGDILGLSAVLSGKHHEETAVAAVPSQTGFIKGKDFLHFLNHHPEAAFWVVQLLSEQVTTTLAHLSCLQHTPFREVRQ
ncbi:MAG TPA: Crp/Fnr family transcriptional regulator [Terriglobia bacterium]|nr:Crp/Fnr family transcriptional regulator [Terriglobia bacterium]